MTERSMAAKALSEGGDFPSSENSYHNNAHA